VLYICGLQLRSIVGLEIIYSIKYLVRLAVVRRKLTKPIASSATPTAGLMQSERKVFRCYICPERLFEQCDGIPSPSTLWLILGMIAARISQNYERAARKFDSSLNWVCVEVFSVRGKHSHH
jgi:hypothetical protein